MNGARDRRKFTTNPGPDGVLFVPFGARLYRELALVATAVSGRWHPCAGCPQKAGEENVTGIFVRAQHPETNGWLTVDMIVLDKTSLLCWLKSRGGDNPWAEDVVGHLLAHGALHEQGGPATLRSRDGGSP